MPDCTCLVEGPIPNHAGVLPSVFGTEEHASRSAEERRVSLAHETNSGGVHDFGHLLNVVDEHLEVGKTREQEYASQVHEDASDDDVTHEAGL